MISDKDLGYRLTDELVDRCATLIERSNAVELIEQYYDEGRGVGGRRPAGRAFTLLGYLTAGLALVIIGRTASLAEIYRLLCAFPDHLLLRVGMDPTEQNVPTYTAFQGWVTRRLESLDPGSDLPARRVKNKIHRAQIAARTLQQQEASELADHRLHNVMNRIIAASIDDPAPPGGRGDVVIDETTVDLAGPSEGLGSKNDKARGAAYSGAYYVRDRVDNSLSTSENTPQLRRKTSSGFGIGVTAVSRLGPVEDLYAIPAVITAVAMQTPTSGSVGAARAALEMHQLHGLDQRLGPRARQPYLTVDMAYNQKKNFTDLCLDLGYSPVVRYPVSWNTLRASDTPEHTVGGQPAGPVQISGDFYCPAAQAMVDGWKVVRKTIDLLSDTDGFDQHDRRLEKVLPLLMGTNSRPYRKRDKRGRPKNGEATEAGQVRIDLVCPAVQGRVRCPLKPASLTLAGLEAPLLSPAWPAERYRCCSKSQVTVPFSKDQWRMATWGLTPGSWEHATYFEAARSATEQRFSIMKSPHTTGIEHLKWAPRREPLLGLLVGMWVAATNMFIQDAHPTRRQKPPSIKEKMAQIEADLGRPPVKIPPRT